MATAQNVADRLSSIRVPPRRPGWPGATAVAAGVACTLAAFATGVVRTDAFSPLWSSVADAGAFPMGRCSQACWSEASSVRSSRGPWRLRLRPWALPRNTSCGWGAMPAIVPSAAWPLLLAFTGTVFALCTVAASLVDPADLAEVFVAPDLLAGVIAGNVFEALRRRMRGRGRRTTFQASRSGPRRRLTLRGRVCPRTAAARRQRA